MFTTAVSNPAARFTISLSDPQGVGLPVTGQEYAAPWTGFDWLTPGTYRLKVTAHVPQRQGPVDLVVRDVLRSGADFGRIVVDEAWQQPRSIAAGERVEVPATAVLGEVPAPPGRRLFGIGFLRLDETSMYAFPR